MVALASTASFDRGADSIALWRLYLLRAGYLFGAVGLGNIMVPAFLHHGPWTIAQGVKNSMLLALATCWVLGLRYPLKMLPMLFFEIMWKTFWLAFIALPAWRAGPLSADMQDTVFAVSLVPIVLVFVPWDYVWRHYVIAPGDRWR